MVVGGNPGRTLGKRAASSPRESRGCSRSDFWPVDCIPLSGSSARPPNIGLRSIYLGLALSRSLGKQPNFAREPLG